jgi:hypothetical protein
MQHQRRFKGVRGRASRTGSLRLVARFLLLVVLVVVVLVVEVRLLGGGDVDTRMSQRGRVDQGGQESTSGCCRGWKGLQQQGRGRRVGRDGRPCLVLLLLLLLSLLLLLFHLGFPISDSIVDEPIIESLDINACLLTEVCLFLIGRIGMVHMSEQPSFENFHHTRGQTVGPSPTLGRDDDRERWGCGGGYHGGYHGGCHGDVGVYVLEGEEVCLFVCHM